MTRIPATEIRAGDILASDARPGEQIEIEYVQAFEEMFLRGGKISIPPCVLVFYGGNRRFSHTFDIDDTVTLIRRVKDDKDTSV